MKSAKWLVVLGAALLLCACPPRPMYTVSYDGNGADGGSVPVDTTLYHEGDTVTVADPGTMSRGGYEFAQWNTLRNGAGQGYTGVQTLTIGAEDVTLYAQWTATGPATAPVVTYAYTLTTVELWSGFVIGTASDAQGVARVEYDTGSGWETATGTTSWKFPVPHTQEWRIGRTHVVSVRAQDTTGLWSDAENLTVKIARNKDCNGDGYADVLTGSYWADAGGTERGRVDVFLGGASMDAVADLTMNGVADGDRFGSSVAWAGDLNGDGYADAAVGAPYATGEEGRGGLVYLYWGGASMDAVADLILDGCFPGNCMGYSVAAAGDVNGDGFDDLIVGIPYATGSVGGVLGYCGQVCVYLGGSTMNTDADLAIVDTELASDFGCCVAGAGDVNGDDYADVIVGAGSGGTVGTNRGRAYVYHGGPAMDNVADLTLSGAADSDRLGSAVAGAGDTNKDGYADIVVGARGADAVGSDRGQVYLYRGGPSMVAVADVTLSGSANGDGFGYSVASAGDVNGDGYSDIVAGGVGIGVAGQARVYLGGTAMDAVPDATLDGVESGDLCGCAVATLGDVDADGYADVVVGADSASGGGSDRGEAYVLCGAAEVDSVCDLVLRGVSNDGRLGASVD